MSSKPSAINTSLSEIIPGNKGLKSNKTNRIKIRLQLMTNSRIPAELNKWQTGKPLSPIWASSSISRK